MWPVVQEDETQGVPFLGEILPHHRIVTPFVLVKAVRRNHLSILGQVLGAKLIWKAAEDVEDSGFIDIGKFHWYVHLLPVYRDECRQRQPALCGRGSGSRASFPSCRGVRAAELAAQVLWRTADRVRERTRAVDPARFVWVDETGSHRGLTPASVGPHAGSGPAGVAPRHRGPSCMLITALTLDGSGPGLLVDQAFDRSAFDGSIIHLLAPTLE